MNHNAHLRRQIPDDFVEMVQRLSQKSLTKHYQASVRTIRKWVLESGLSLPGRDMLPRPADFAAVYPTLPGQVAVAKHYRTTPKVVRRWMKEAGIEARVSEQRPMPADFPQVAPTMLRSHLRDHYRTSDSTIKRWVSESGVQPLALVKAVKFPRTTSIVPTRGGGKANITITRITTIYDDAADVLRRFCPVYRCNEDGSPNQRGRFWRMGWSIMTPDELLERAARKRAA